MNESLFERGLALLRIGTKNPKAAFHDGQWEAIQALVADRARLLLVRRTGWGKSIVYFIAAALLRERRTGPTLIISPLISLMRNQLEAAVGMGLRCKRIDSTNRDEWQQIFADMAADNVDVLLVSPERLANREFLASLGQQLFARLGMLVVDEAHCISDWGHDFRPHYLLIARFARFLPPNVSMLATTATADDTVISDVCEQLGTDLTVSRGALGRDSLFLDVDTQRSYAERLAWLVAALPLLPGTGIIYTLTTRDADLVAEWLRSRGFEALAYHAGIDDRERELREAALLADNLKALVATTALGMGFDKGNIGFVVHFQGTQSLVHYYQQVGRAGRAVDRAVGVLLGGSEDDDIVEFFIRNALPPQELVENTLRALEDSAEGLSVPMLMAAINEADGRIKAVTKFLELEEPSPVIKLRSKYLRSAVPYEYPVDRVKQLASRRRAQRTDMDAYANGGRCLMQALSESLGDAAAGRCGRCSVCTGRHIVDVGEIEALTTVAEDFLNRREIRLTPRRKWPQGGLPNYGFRSNATIEEELRAEEGRSLSYFQVGSNGRRLRDEKYRLGSFSDDSVRQAAAFIEHWDPHPRPLWVAAMPSDHRPNLVPDFAKRLAGALGLRYVEALRKTRPTENQKAMQNNSFRAKNLDGSLEVVAGAPLDGPGLFVDDMYDSGMTVTVAVALLKRAGAGPVHPFTLSKASNRE